MNERWDVAALRAGASVALVFAAPFLIAARVIDDPDSALNLPLVLAAILGFVLGAGVAAWRQQRGTPLSHGIVTAGGTFVVVQGVFVIVNLIRGADVHWLNIFFNLTSAVFAGMIGGMLGLNLTKRGIEPRR
ncbi:MAG: TIGR04086 family membrane protein [Ilumatobacteraceae bacterium]